MNHTCSSVCVRERQTDRHRERDMETEGTLLAFIHMFPLSPYLSLCVCLSVSLSHTHCYMCDSLTQQPLPTSWCLPWTSPATADTMKLTLRTPPSPRTVAQTPAPRGHRESPPRGRAQGCDERTGWVGWTAEAWERLRLAWFWSPWPQRPSSHSSEAN